MNQASINFPDDWSNPTTPGFGTFPGPYGYLNMHEHYEGVKSALQTGYRHIDNAQTYKNEMYVGKALIEFGNRQQLFITSKLNPSQNSRQGATASISLILNNLNLKYLDMFLIHYPGEGNWVEAWRSMLESRSAGLCRRIGVSNFEIRHLQELNEVFSQYPEVNQIEFHPLLYGDHLRELVTFCKVNKIKVEGYCPLAQFDPILVNSEEVRKIAAKYGKPATQIILAWSMQHGVRPIFGSRKSAHISECFGPYNFSLTQEEMESINSFGRYNRRISIKWGWDPTKV